MTMLRGFQFSALAFAIAAGGFLGAPILFATATPKPECQLARDWVKANRDRLPTTLAALAAFPRAYRLEIFTALPKEAKASLWRARYEQLLARPLTPGQRKLVEEAIPLMTPELYAVIGQGRMPADWAARAKEEFTRTNGLSWITDLADSPGSYDVLPVNLRPAAASSNRASNALLPTCTCAVSEDNDLCPAQGLKCCGFNNCDTPAGGCGLSGLNFCDGLCRQATHPECWGGRS